MSRIISNFYFEFNIYGILLVSVIGLVEIYLADHQTSQNRYVCYLSL